jgi:hypothetical protein
MSRLMIGILGAVAVSLSVGAGQLALGSDLAGAAADVSVNRATKADRALNGSVSPVKTRTVALRLSSFVDTSFLVRLPLANGTGNPSSIKPATARTTLACEPVVSMLTEVAKQLQPGRCVT